MKNALKRAMTYFIVLSLLIGVVPAMTITSFAATSGTCGTNVTWSYDEATASLTISGIGEMSGYSYNGGNVLMPWKTYKTTIQHLKIESGVTSIGNYAFYGCTALTDIEFCDTLTKLGYACFSECTGLKSAVVPDSVAEVGTEAFYGCTGLEELVLPEEARLSDNDIRHMISSASAKQIRRLVLPSSVTKIPASFFENNENLESIGMPGVYDIGQYAFSGCTSLKKVLIHPASYSIVIGDYAFYGCDDLAVLGLKSCSSIGKYAFAGCPKLKSIYNLNPGTFDSSYNFSANSSAFYGVNASVYYQYEYAHSGNIGGGTFNWIKATSGLCGNDAYWEYDAENSLLTISGSGPIFYQSSGAQMPWYNYRSNITKIVIEDGITRIPAYAFEYMQNAEKVILPDTMEVLYPNAFNDCQVLNNLVIPASIRLVYSAQVCYWYRCPNLTDVYYVGTAEEWNKVYTAQSTAYIIAPHFLTLHKATQTCTKVGLPAYYAFDGTSNTTLYDTDKKEWQKPQPYALGHSFTNYVSNNNATCTLDGTKTAKCDRCSVTDTVTDENSALGHSFTLYVPYTSATCISDATKRAKCNRCNATDTIVIPGTKLSHNYCGNAGANGNGTHSYMCINGCGNYGGTVNCSGGEATCTDKAVCSLCGSEYGDALGHNYVLNYKNGEHPHNEEYTCSRCYDKKTVNEVYSADCPECNYTWVDIDESSCKITGYTGNLSKVTIPSTINGKKVISTYSGALKGNTAITEVKIESGVSEIGSLTFMNCSHLKKVVIPDSVDKIGSMAFYGCHGDLTIYCFRNSAAHIYAQQNSINYVVLDIAETEYSVIDYENKYIFTTATNVSNIAYIVGIPTTTLAVPQASSLQGNAELFGTGSMLTVFENNNFSGDYTIIVEGDLDGDSVSDVIDVMLAEKAVSNKTTLSSMQKYAANGCLSDEMDIAAYQNVVNAALS